MSAAEKCGKPQGAAPAAAELGVRIRKILARCQKAGVAPEAVNALKAAKKLRGDSSTSGRQFSEAAKVFLGAATGVVCLVALFWLSGAALSSRVVSTWLALSGKDIRDEKVNILKFTILFIFLYICCFVQT